MKVEKVYHTKWEVIPECVDDCDLIDRLEENYDVYIVGSKTITIIGEKYYINFPIKGMVSK